MCIRDRDGTDWKEIKKGTFQLKDGVTTVHFDKENDGKYYIYDAAYVKITALDSNRFAATAVSYTHLDVYKRQAPTLIQRANPTVRSWPSARAL